jgi:hypothetical protein
MLLKREINELETVLLYMFEEKRGWSGESKNGECGRHTKGLES